MKNNLDNESACRLEGYVACLFSFLFLAVHVPDCFLLIQCVYIYKIMSSGLAACLVMMMALDLQSAQYALQVMLRTQWCCQRVEGSV